MTSLARISNDFAPSDQAIELESLLATAEVAARLNVTVKALSHRISRLGMQLAIRSAHYRYWNRHQVEYLRGRL